MKRKEKTEKKTTTTEKIVDGQIIEVWPGVVYQKKGSAMVRVYGV